MTHMAEEWNNKHIQIQITTSYTGWWYTYPSEKYEFVSWDDEIPFPTVSGKPFKIPWFQSPPTSNPIINPIINQY